jgi:hypothetical protein
LNVYTALRSDVELKKAPALFQIRHRQPKQGRLFHRRADGSIFELGKEFKDMPTAEIEKLMYSPIHEVRAGALSILGQCAKGKTCSEARLKDL